MLGCRGPYVAPASLPPGLRYLEAAALPPLFQFPPDMSSVDVEPNRLNNQALVRYYEQEWTAINR